MPNRTLYLRDETERELEVIFNHIKSLGDIPSNATDIGKYRAQCVAFAIRHTVNDLLPRTPKPSQTN
jgi:hypothetical protein